LHQLDVEDAGGARRLDERQRVAVGQEGLVGRDPLPIFLGKGPEALAGRNRLLEELEAERPGLAEEPGGLLRRYALARLRPERDGVLRVFLAQLAEPLEILVERVAGLDLQDAEPAADVFVRFGEGLRDVLDANRDRRRERVVRAPQHVDERDAEALREQIVERAVHRGPGGRGLRCAALELAAQR